MHGFKARRELIELGDRTRDDLRHRDHRRGRRPALCRGLAAAARDQRGDAQSEKCSYGSHELPSKIAVGTRQPSWVQILINTAMLLNSSAGGVRKRSSEGWSALSLEVCARAETQGR